MNRSGRILIVENDLSWQEYFGKILNAVGDQRKREFVGSIQELKTKYSSSASFDDVSLCILDLELGPHVEKLADTDGLDLALPYIREKAPWLAVCCMSSYIKSEDTIPRLSTSDFDGLFPKTGVMQLGGKTAPDFNEAQWNFFIQNLDIKRAAWLSGLPIYLVQNFIKEAKFTRLILSSHLESILCEEQLRENFIVGLKLLGVWGEALTVSELTGGFSGINTVKVISSGTGHSSSLGIWVVKFGSSIRKLKEESDGHQTAFARGFARRHQVSQMHRQVICWQGIGYLGYSFESDASTALEYIETGKSADVIRCINTLSQNMYVNTSQEGIRFRDILMEWFHLPKKDAENEENALGGLPMLVSRSYIHGDFHLRNILICNNIPVVIDFARAKPGPICLDIAKLIVDFCTFTSASFNELAQAISSSSSQNNSASLYLEALSPKTLTADDRKLLIMLIKQYCKKYLTYPDVPQEKKEQITEYLLNENGS